MNNIYLPAIANGESGDVTIQAATRKGYALYGVAHNQFHTQLAAGRDIQNWVARACCLRAAQATGAGRYYPALSLEYWLAIDAFRQLVANYPGLDWSLINEPNVYSQQPMLPKEWNGIASEWAAAIRATGGRIIGPNIAVQPPQDQAVWIPWRLYLDWLLALANPTIPDVWGFHVYAHDIAEWQDLVDQFLAYTAEKGVAHPCVMTETGCTQTTNETATRTLFDHVMAYQHPRIESILWFTNEPQQWQLPTSITQKTEAVMTAPNLRRNPARSAWRATVRALALDETDHAPRCLIDCYDAAGNQLRNTSLRIRYGWDGMRPEETPPLGQLDKPPTELGGLHIPMWPGQRLWCEVAGTEYASDRVIDLTNTNTYAIEFHLTP